MPDASAPSRPVLHILDHYDAAAPDAMRLHLAARGFALDIRRCDRGDPVPRAEELDAGLILTGGLQMVTEIDALPWMAAEVALIRAAQARGVPTLGICLGGQMIAHALGAAVGPHPAGCAALGCYPLTPAPAAAGLIPEGLVPLAGNMQGFALPEGAELLASAALFPVQAFRARGAYALQFHPEATAPILDQWNRELATEPLLPGQQSIPARDAAFARHDPAVKAWFAGFLDTIFAPPPPA